MNEVWLGLIYLGGVLLVAGVVGYWMEWHEQRHERDEHEYHFKDDTEIKDDTQ